MIYIENNSMDAAFAFAMEYYFAKEHRFNEPVFLFWRTTPTLMVGKYQNVLEEINKPYADAHGINIIRRMSGGGTIYTDEGGWQFTFIQHGAGKEITFQEYTRPILEALQELGVPATFNGRNDLTVHGKKFSGNAQYHLGECTVHHGSLLFDTNLAQMVAATTVDPEKIRSKSIQSVRDRVTNLLPHLKAPISTEMFRETMVRHILGGGRVYIPSLKENARMEEIAQEKFRSWEMVFGKSPKFNIDRSRRLAGGKMQFQIDVQKGRIASAAVYGDFFSSLNAETIAGALLGCPYERGAVLAALQAHGIDGAVYRISAKEMAEIIVD